MAQHVSALSAFFSPKSVAVIGASSDPKKPGNTALRNMISMGYKGKLFPVNPRERTVLGLPCYKSVRDIPEPVELCVLLVAAELTVPVAKELAERKSRVNDVAAVVCMSAGFGELNTPEASQREQDLVAILRSAIHTPHRPELPRRHGHRERVQHQLRHRHPTRAAESASSPRAAPSATRS